MSSAAIQQNQIHLKVLNVYRRLLKAQRFTFGQDKQQIKSAQLFTRNEFMKNKNVAQEQEIQKCLEVAESAEQIIRKNLVQELRITNETEINDNDTIKLASAEWKAKKVAVATNRSRKKSNSSKDNSETEQRST